MIRSSDLIDWPKILPVEFDYRYYRFNQIFGYRLRALAHRLIVQLIKAIILLQKCTYVSENFDIKQSS